MADPAILSGEFQDYGQDTSADQESRATPARGWVDPAADDLAAHEAAGACQQL